MDSDKRRFLIDSIDEKLGSVENELKFDVVMIVVGVALLVVSIVVVALCADAHPALTVVCILLAIFAAALTFFMVKEFLADLKKR